jgi:hypothetical protein
MKESRNASNMMVVVKLCIILLVIAVGVFYVDTDNGLLAPNGVNGFKGVSAVFFFALDLMRFQQQPKNVRTHNRFTTRYDVGDYYLPYCMLSLHWFNWYGKL